MIRHAQMTPDRFTDGHYKELQELYQSYKEKGFEILAFPCDQFKQAKGDSCRLDVEKYKITFEMFDKVSSLLLLSSHNSGLSSVRTD